MLSIDRRFDEIARVLHHSRVNPVNIADIQRRFLLKQFTPSFVYAPLRDPIDDLKKQLSTVIVRGDAAMHALLKAKKKELAIKMDMLASIGTDDFEKYAHRLYPRPSASLVNKAYALMDLPPTPESPYIRKDEARRLLRESMTRLGFNWKISTEHLITSAKVDPLGRRLVLRKKERFHLRFVQRLAVHEIGTHAARAENGALQPLKLFVHGLPGYLDTEEGLAAYNEERAGILDPSTLKNYAGRVIAVDAALRSSFLETYRELRSHFSTKQALKLTLRAKRGLEHPGAPGAFTRDVTYLRGYYKVKEFVRRGGRVHDLMLGKIGVEHVGLVKMIPEVVPARYLPETLFSLFDREVF